jgi:hypothetical protein
MNSRVSYEAPDCSSSYVDVRAPSFAVEKARNRSPEKCDPVVPVRASPSGTRRHRARHWSGSSGASVATTTITEPAPGAVGVPVSGGSGTSSRSPTRTPAIVSSRLAPKLACTKTPTVKSLPRCCTDRDAVPDPALNP